MYICICGTRMDYIIPNDESTPPRLECPKCGKRQIACGDDHRYTNKEIMLSKGW